MLWETMGLMLAGMALFRAHMLTGEWAAGRHRKWAIVSFTVTNPPLAALAAWQIGPGLDPRSDECRVGNECGRNCRSWGTPVHYTSKVSLTLISLISDLTLL